MSIPDTDKLTTKIVLLFCIFLLASAASAYLYGHFEMLSLFLKSLKVAGIPEWPLIYLPLTLYIALHIIWTLLGLLSVMLDSPIFTEKLLKSRVTAYRDTLAIVRKLPADNKELTKLAKEFKPRLTKALKTALKDLEEERLRKASLRQANERVKKKISSWLDGPQLDVYIVILVRFICLVLIAALIDSRSFSTNTKYMLFALLVLLAHSELIWFLWYKLRPLKFVAHRYASIQIKAELRKISKLHVEIETKLPKHN